MKQYPLISCMMLTYNRFTQFKKAVDCFLKQTYPNKELIIINSGDVVYYNNIKKYLNRIENDFENIDSRYLHIHVDADSLGMLRNKGIYYSTGEYIAVFDDDDIHHEDRLSKQISLCLNSNIHATILRNFTAVKHGWFKDRKHKCSILKGLEGTILFLKGDVEYPDMNQGEDTNFVDNLKNNNYNMAIIDEPYEMYEYHFYGNNTVSKEHFNNMIDSNKPLR